MRKLPSIIAGAGLLLAVAAPVVIGNTDRAFRASMNGYLETPSVSTTARGQFRATINARSITYRLQYRDLSTPPLFAHIHLGRPDVMGGVSVFLCGGGSKPACPASGTVTGTIVPADVIGPSGQGIAAGEFAELVRAIRNGATYANLHTEMFPGGEIRGNIRRVD
jgi:CHRD domain-containing protein